MRGEEVEKKLYVTVYICTKIRCARERYEEKNTHRILYTCRRNDRKAARMSERARAHEFEKEKKSHN